MVSQAGTGGVRPFLQLLEVQALRGAADRDLLGRVAAADEAAFRVVAERHGPMVFGVCARLLGNRHDAEDALQATFLVLARRAAAVRKSESLASWLHGVARRVALRLRRADRRRAAREKAAAAPDAHAPADSLAWAEVRAGLDEELTRLPAAYRDVLVLCYLEGLSRDEAGQRLGLDAGAVKGRLERGRRLLGERLVRRGIGLSAGLASLAVAPEATAALRLGRLAADPTAASPRAAALSHEFLKGVAMSKFKLVTAGVAGVLVLAVGVGTAQPPKPAPPADTVRSRPGPDQDSDEAFIRRLSRDLRGTDPTPAEVHFFLASKDANKRGTLIDLFVKERAVKDFGQGAKLGARIEDLARQPDVEAVRRYAEAVQLAHAREAQARADAEKAAAQAAERAAWAERMVKQGYLSAGQAEVERQRATAARNAAARAEAEKAEQAVAEREAQLRRAADKTARAEEAEADALARKLRELYDQVRREDERLRAMVEAERAARDAAEAQRRDADRAADAARAAELLAREAAKRKEKDARPPADPTRPADPRPIEKGFRVPDPKAPPTIDPRAKPTEKGFREVDDPVRPATPRPVDPVRPPDPRPTETKKTPPAVPSTPALPGAPVPVVPGSRNIVPGAPAPVPPPVAPAPAANVEVLKVRVQLAEVTLREKQLDAQNTEKLAKQNVVSAGEVDRAKLAVERAMLQLREAQLLLEQAARSEPRAVPPATRP